ncbi:TonB-dependent receptor plug domain-containing protein [Planctobacterium marinum]|uniref:Ligand-gated channel n=1 Tax=Planctobacterium marinum TaxID=1631968 RepID=A0AA48KU93_9ALTE|nr:ligand-gated channel [Planctobacterium marinum]
MKKTYLTLCCAALLSSQATFAEENTDNSLEKITVVSAGIEQNINELSASVAVLNEEDLIGRYQLSVADTLRTVAGIHVSNSGGLGKNTVLRVRGEESFRTRLYVDGVELTDPTAPQLTPVLDDLLLNNVSRIELLKGPQGLIYGADAGGVVRVTTQETGEGLSGNIAAEFAGFGTQQYSASLNLGNKTSGIMLNVSDLSSDGINAQSTDVSGETDGYDNTTLHLKGQHQFNEQLGLQLVIRSTEGETQYDGCFDNTTFAPINNCVTESEQTSARLALQYRTEAMQHSLGYAITDVEKDFINNGEFGFGNEGEIRRLDYQGWYQLGADTISFGVDFKAEEDVLNSTDRDNKGYFVEWLSERFDNINLNLGVRYDDNDTFGSFTSWRGGINYLLPLQNQQSLRFKATWGTGFRAPGLFEQAYNDGPFAYGDAAGLQLKEETSQGYDLGLIHKVSANTWWSLTWFEQQIEDEILFDAVAFQGYLQTSGKSDSQGIEFETESTLSNGDKIWFNYTYMDSEDQAGNQRLRRPEQLANLGYQQEFNDGQTRWSLYAHLEKGAVDIGNMPLSNFVTVNGNIVWDLTATLTAQAYINNLFDREYTEVQGFNTQGRHLGVKLALSF